jgi:hypothetical protein
VERFSVNADGAATPAGIFVSSVALSVVAPLAAGIVIDDELTPEIAENVSVVDPVVDVEPDEVELWVPTAPPPTLLVPPPPHAESIAVTTMPTKTHDRRGQRTMKPPVRTPQLHAKVDGWFGRRSASFLASKRLLVRVY